MNPTTINMTNIKNGTVFKNYKNMCELLELQVKTGNAKKAQIKEIERFLQLEQQGNSLIVKKVYQFPKEKINNRGLNTIYSDTMQLLLLNMLAKEKGNHFILSKSKLFEHMELINQSYTYARYNQNLLSDYYGISQEVVDEYFNINHRTLSDAMNTAIKKLENKMLIICNTGYGLVFKNKNYDNSSECVTNYITRPATQEEMKIILQTEHDIMVEDYGVENINQLYSSQQFYNYRKTCMKVVKTILKCHKYFRAFDITFHEAVISERDKMEKYLLNPNLLVENKQLINQTVNSEDTKKAIRRQHEAEEKLKLLWGEVHDPILLMRGKKDYVDDITTISNGVIFKGNDDLKAELKLLQEEQKQQTILPKV